MISHEPTPIYWQDQLVGHIANLKFDMFHYYGNWLPETNEVNALLMTKLKNGNEEWVGVNEIKPTHYISLESFGSIGSQITIDLVQGVNPPCDWS